MYILDKNKPRESAITPKNGVLFLSGYEIQRISEFQHSFEFLNPTEKFDAYFTAFLRSDLGKIYTAIPWKDLIEVFKLKESTKGTKNHFSPKGKLALMFLKHYTCLFRQSFNRATQRQY
jgi:hypothetical protein